MKGHWHLFTDGSVNTQSKVDYGAYLLLEDISDSVALFKE
jgi:hypothetical protein